MIQGRRVTLRPVEEADLPHVLRWQNDPAVWWALDLERPVSSDDVRDEVERARRDGHPFIVWLEDRPIGWIGLDAFRGRDRICSLSMYLGEPTSWEHGRDALMALASFAFDRFDLARIEVRTLAGNDRLLDVCDAGGFVRDAVLPERSWKDGRWVDHVILSATRGSFAEARSRWEASA